MKNILLLFFGITTLLIAVTAKYAKIWTPFFMISSFYMMYIAIERFIKYLKQKHAEKPNEETNGNE